MLYQLRPPQWNAMERGRTVVISEVMRDQCSPPISCMSIESWACQDVQRSWYVQATTRRIDAKNSALMRKYFGLQAVAREADQRTPLLLLSQLQLMYGRCSPAQGPTTLRSHARGQPKYTDEVFDSDLRRCKANHGNPLALLLFSQLDLH